MVEREVKSTMCVPVQNQSCNWLGTCCCVSTHTIEDEIKMLEAGRKRMQVQINMTDRRIEELKKQI
jgi:hypothetical protein